MEMNNILKSVVGLICLVSGSFTQTLNIPVRPTNAPGGQAFIQQISSLDRDTRETQIFLQIMAGNVPDFLRQLVPVTVNAIIGGTNHTVTFYVTPDYLAVGSDEDYFLTPMTPLLGQKLADSLNCTLPTKKMVDAIYQAATVKLPPQPIAPSAAMITVPVFAQHNDSVWSLRQPLLDTHPLGELVGGTKKDVIISNKIYYNLKATVPHPVVIYGWHYLSGTPIQPVYNGHEQTYADYSHGIRLIQNAIIVDGQPGTVQEVLRSVTLNSLLSDEGQINIPRYGALVLTAPTPKSFGVFPVDNQSICVKLKPSDNTVYYAYPSGDGLNFADSVLLSEAETVISGLPADTICYIRIRAFEDYIPSVFSEVLAATPSSASTNVLIVNGFDRATAGNTKNFIRQHGQAFRQNGKIFASATNDALTDGLFDLSDYAIVDVILGEESTADTTFSPAEQSLVKTYLQNGGKLFVSGAEIAWDLDYKGGTDDKSFYKEYLKASYVYDNPGSTAGTYFSLEPVPGQLFDGLGNFNFDNGNYGTYIVKWPDVITGVNGGVNCLQYSGLTSNFAAVSYSGLFPGGTIPGKMVNLGVPFETIYPDSVRTKMMAMILDFFASADEITTVNAELPEIFDLAQNYPNPCNASTIIPFNLPNQQKARLSIYDLNGRLVSEPIDGYLTAGLHRVVLDVSRLASGFYLYQLTTPELSKTRKMEILK
jgi:hypothetical protein